MDGVTRKGDPFSDVLVSTAWVHDHLEDSDIRIVESSGNQLHYQSAHIPGALELGDIGDHARSDLLTDLGFSRMVSNLAITPETTVILYSASSDCWATYAFWLFQLFGHPHVRIMDGGRWKWEKEGRPFTEEIPVLEETDYTLRFQSDFVDRISREGVGYHFQDKLPAIEVPSAEEYRVQRLESESYPIVIPGVRSVPWCEAVEEHDGSFKSIGQLQEIFENKAGLNPDDEVLTYGRVVAGGSHAWFVLKYLLGFRRVRYFDGAANELESAFETYSLDDSGQRIGGQI